MLVFLDILMVTGHQHITLQALISKQNTCSDKVVA